MFFVNISERFSFDVMYFDLGTIKSSIEIDIPESMGLIIRTAGANKTRNEISQDLSQTINIWEEIKIPKNYKTDKAMLSLFYNDWYGGYVKWDVFSKKFKSKIKLTN